MSVVIRHCPMPGCCRPLAANVLLCHRCDYILDRDLLGEHARQALRGEYVWSVSHTTLDAVLLRVGGPQSFVWRHPLRWVYKLRDGRDTSRAWVVNVERAGPGSLFTPDNVNLTGDEPYFVTVNLRHAVAGRWNIFLEHDETGCARLLTSHDHLDAQLQAERALGLEPFMRPTVPTVMVNA